MNERLLHQRMMAGSLLQEPSPHHSEEPIPSAGIGFVKFIRERTRYTIEIPETLSARMRHSDIGPADVIKLIEMLLAGRLRRVVKKAGTNERR